MHKLDENFYLIVSPIILMNFIAFKYEIEEHYHEVLVGFRSQFLIKILWIAQQAPMSSKIGNSLLIASHATLNITFASKIFIALWKHNKL